tara:strand:- start:526 stop:789 length:264 start_codon:yes stop_codon:yes gene_type:complete
MNISASRASTLRVREFTGNDWRLFALCASLFYLCFYFFKSSEQEAPNICEKVWKDELELVPLHYIPDLSGVLKGPYQDNWFDPTAED